MDTRLPVPIIHERIPTSPKARLAKDGKSARLKGVSAISRGKPFPPHFPPLSGPNVRDNGASGPPLPLGRPLSIAEAARLIGCSPWTVRQTLIPMGLPHLRFKASGRLTFYEDQVVRWIEEKQSEGGFK